MQMNKIGLINVDETETPTEVDFVKMMEVNNIENLAKGIAVEMMDIEVELLNVDNVAMMKVD